MWFTIWFAVGFTKTFLFLFIDFINWLAYTFKDAHDLRFVVWLPLSRHLLKVYVAYTLVLGGNHGAQLVVKGPGVPQDWLHRLIDLLWYGLHVNASPYLLEYQRYVLLLFALTATACTRPKDTAESWKRLHIWASASARSIGLVGALLNEILLLALAEEVHLLAQLLDLSLHLVDLFKHLENRVWRAQRITPVEWIEAYIFITFVTINGIEILIELLGLTVVVIAKVLLHQFALFLELVRWVLLGVVGFQVVNSIHNNLFLVFLLFFLQVSILVQTILRLLVSISLIGAFFAIWIGERARNIHAIANRNDVFVHPFHYSVV